MKSENETDKIFSRIRDIITTPNFNIKDQVQEIGECYNEIIKQTHQDNMAITKLATLHSIIRVKTQYTSRNKKIQYNNVVNQLDKAADWKLDKNPSLQLIKDLKNIPGKVRQNLYSQMSQQMKEIISSTPLVSKDVNFSDIPGQVRQKIRIDHLKRKTNKQSPKQVHEKTIRNQTTYNNDFQNRLNQTKCWKEVWDLHKELHQSYDDILIKKFLLLYHKEAIQLMKQKKLYPNLEFMCLEPPI